MGRSIYAIDGFIETGSSPGRGVDRYRIGVNGMYGYIWVSSSLTGYFAPPGRCLPLPKAF